MATFTSSLMTSRRGEASNSSSSQLHKKSPAVRSRASNAPDFGTPIKVESSSPYRTPEANSKASTLLARTPFGTPQKTLVAPSTTSAFRPNSLPAKPPQPLTGRAHVNARIRSLWQGSSAAASTILQAKGHLPYSALAKLMLQTNLDRLHLLSFLAIHLFFSLALFSPLQPFTSVLRSLQPSLLLLSTMAYTSSIFPLIMLLRASISSSGQLKAAPITPLQEYKLAGFTLQGGSPAAHYYLVFSQLRMGIFVLLHASSGLFLAAFQAIALIIYSKNSSDWLPYQTVTFRSSQGLRISSLRPNERFFFLLGCNFIVGSLFCLYRIVAFSTFSDSAGPNREIQFEAQATLQSPAIRIKSKLRRRLPKSVAIGFVLPILTLLFYVVSRRPLFRLILSIIGQDSALRSVLIPSFRKTFFSLSYVFRSSTLGAFSAATWETVAILWEVFATQPFNDLHGGLSQYSREPSKCLIEGMQIRRMNIVKEGEPTIGERQYYAQFAFAEMAVVTATDYERRRAIFREVGSGTSNGSMISGNKSAWASIAEECIKVIENEKLTAANRGRPTTIKKTSASTNTSKLQLKADDASHRIPVENNSSVMKKSAISIWDKLASSNGSNSDNTFASAQPCAPSTTSAAQPDDQDEGLGSVLRRLVPPSATSATSIGGSISTLRASGTTKRAPQSTPTAAAIIFSLVFTSTSSAAIFIYTLLPQDLRHVLSRLPIIRSAIPFQEWVSKPTSTTLLFTGKIPHQAALTTWSIQILGALLSASVDQDEYGTVALSTQQKLGVDDVLEHIATLLQALSEWEFEMTKEMEGQSEAAKREMIALWNHRVVPILNASRTAINLVMGTFEPTGYQMRQSTRDVINKALEMKSL